MVELCMVCFKTRILNRLLIMKLCSRSFVSPTSISSFSCGLKHANRSVKVQSRQNVTVHAVAALEAPGTVPSGASPDDLDTQTAYKQFDELLDEYSVSFKSGDKVVGTVFGVDNKGAYIDVGGKTTAFCPTGELSLNHVSRATDVISPDTVKEFVVIRDEQAGNLIVSLKRIELELAWGRLTQLMEEDAIVSGQVVATNRGGLIVEVENIRGFCPGSQLPRRVASFEELMDEQLSFKITEVDEERQRLMLSARAAAATENPVNFAIGDVVEGIVTSVKPYGAFVEIGGGVSGLLHISQISHDRILNVDKVLADGDKIKVMILSQDKERGRVALCTKKLEPTPGDMLRDPALVYEKAEEMAAVFKERVAAAEAAARAEDGSQ